MVELLPLNVCRTVQYPQKVLAGIKMKVVFSIYDTHKLNMELNLQGFIWTPCAQLAPQETVRKLYHTC
jgi:hypothetical protein